MLETIRHITHIMRPNRWWKNLLIFIPLIFAKSLLNPELFLLTLIGFIALVFTSAGDYIFNDIFDKKRDQLHPQKKLRPLAAEHISTTFAGWLVVLFWALGLFIAYQLSLSFMFMNLALMIMAVVYSVWLKQEIFIDMFTTAINVIIRTTAGVFIIDVNLSPWLILLPFFISMFASSGMRYSDVVYNKLQGNKKAMTEYTREMLLAMMVVTTTLLFSAFTAYIISLREPYLFIALPFFQYTVFRWFYHVLNLHTQKRRSISMFKDGRFVLSIALGVLVMLIILYN